MKSSFVSAVIALTLFVACVATSSAATSLNAGGATIGGWNNGNPAPGNDGTITNNGIFVGGQDFAQIAAGTVTISQTAGTLTGASFGPHNANGNIAYLGSAVYNWNISGGSIQPNAGGIIAPGDRVNLNLSGTGVLKSLSGVGGGGYLAPVGINAFTQTGGSVQDFTMLVNNGSTMTLSGGSATGVGKSVNTFAGMYAYNDYSVAAFGDNSTILFQNGYTASFDPNVSAALLFRTDNTMFPTRPRGKIIFDTTWTGSLSRDNFTLSDWITALSDTGILARSTQVTAGNFSSLFNVVNAGAAGSSISLIPLAAESAPEPSSAAILAIGALAMLNVARKKRSVPVVRG